MLRSLVAGSLVRLEETWLTGIVWTVVTVTKIVEHGCVSRQSLDSGRGLTTIEDGTSELSVDAGGAGSGLLVLTELLLSGIAYRSLWQHNRRCA